MVYNIYKKRDYMTNKELLTEVDKIDKLKATKENYDTFLIDCATARAKLFKIAHTCEIVELSKRSQITLTF